MKLDHFEPIPNGQELAVEKMTVGTLNMCSHDYHSRGKMATAIAHHIQELFIAHGGSNSVHLYFFLPWEMQKGKTLEKGISLILEQQRGTMSAPPGVQSELDVLASKPLYGKL